MFNPSRDQVRQFFFESWRKYRQQQTMTALEGLALQVVLAHPEYHTVLEDADKFMDREYFPEEGETNPFLHMSLHLSLMEQLSIDQPPGIVGAYRALLSSMDEHAAQHVVLDCLAEAVWRAQREGGVPDGVAYLDSIRRASNRTQ